jgi:Ni,Fe-hydrogenase III large subunit
VVSREAALSMQLAGPVARASGVPADARTDDPLYRELRFVPAVRHEGDSLARTLVRVEELATSITLARAALERAARQASHPSPVVAPAAFTLEGPRGPLQAQRTAAQWRLSAPGHQAALQAASKAVIGLEWAAALVVLVSFDLTPWVVRP